MNGHFIEFSGIDLIYVDAMPRGLVSSCRPVLVFLSEPQTQSQVELPLTIEIYGVDVQRLCELGLAGLEPGKEIQCRQRPGNAARLGGIAGRFELGYVLMVEEVEALGQQVRFPPVAETDATP